MSPPKAPKTYRYYETIEYKNGNHKGGSSKGGGKDGGKGKKGGKGVTETPLAKEKRELQQERDAEADRKAVKLLKAQKEKERWGQDEEGIAEEATGEEEEGVIDEAKVKVELDEAKEDLKTQQERLKKRVKGSPGFVSTKAEVGRLEEAIETCKAKLRDAKTPTQQMEGKCKRSRKLADRCDLLSQKNA